LLNIKAKSNNSSSFSHFSTTYISFLGWNSFNVNTYFKD
jgi:hypothetical protein